MRAHLNILAGSRATNASPMSMESQNVSRNRFSTRSTMQLAGQNRFDSNIFAVEKYTECKPCESGCHRKAGKKSTGREYEHSQYIAYGITGGGPERSEHYPHKWIQAEETEAYSQDRRVHGTEPGEDHFKSDQKRHYDQARCVGFVLH